jgi:hypothetical protein
MIHIPYWWVDVWVGDIMIRCDQFGVWGWFDSNILNTLIGC